MEVKAILPPKDVMKIADEVMNQIQKRPAVVRMTVTAEPKRDGVEPLTIEEAYDINLLADGMRYVVAVRSFKSGKKQTWPDRDYLSLDDYDVTIHQNWPD